MISSLYKVLISFYIDVYDVIKSFCMVKTCMYCGERVACTCADLKQGEGGGSGGPDPLLLQNPNFVKLHYKITRNIFQTPPPLRDSNNRRTSPPPPPWRNVLDPRMMQHWVCTYTTMYIYICVTTTCTLYTYIDNVHI